MPEVQVLAPPSASGVLEKFLPHSRIVYLRPGESAVVGKKGQKGEEGKIRVVATSGDTLGPPWQAPENGYVLQFERSSSGYSSLYYEPHCRYEVGEAREEKERQSRRVDDEGLARGVGAGTTLRSSSGWGCRRMSS